MSRIVVLKLSIELRRESNNDSGKMPPWLRRFPRVNEPPSGSVLELARRAGIRVRETPLAAARLARASEIFLTGSVIEILPVVELDGAAVGRGTPGEHTASLSAAVEAWLTEDKVAVLSVVPEAAAAGGEE